MTRLALAACAGFFLVLGAQAADTPAAEKTKTERLKVKVSVEWKDLFLRECLKELVGAMDDAGLDKIEVRYATGVSMNTRMTYSGKDKTIAEVLEAFLKANDLTYEVISKKGDKTDGGILVKKK